jgi:hypothetical protein
MKKITLDEIPQDFKNKVGFPDEAIQITSQEETGIELPEDSEIDNKAYIYANEENNNFLLEIYNSSEYYISDDISELQKQASESIYEETLNKVEAINDIKNN